MANFKNKFLLPFECNPWIEGLEHGGTLDFEVLRHVSEKGGIT